LIKLDKTQIDWLKDCVTGSWTLTPEGKIDVVGTVNCSSQKIRKFPVKFGKIIGKGNFTAEWSEIETLEGAPDFLMSYFSVNGCNLLKTLEHCPLQTSKIYFSGCRNLESLIDLPVNSDSLSFDKQNKLDKNLLDLMLEQKKLLDDSMIDWSTFRKTVLSLEKRPKLLQGKNLGLF
jgi:hypothetical protein